MKKTKKGDFLVLGNKINWRQLFRFDNRKVRKTKVMVTCIRFTERLKH